MHNTVEAPSVFNYLDVVQYLQAYYDFRKSKDRKFSYRAWSNELKFNSRSFLRLVLASKKKLPPKLAESIALTHFDDSTQADYFRCLVGYSKSIAQSEKEIFGNRMIQILKTTEYSTPTFSIELELTRDLNESLDTSRYPTGKFLLSVEHRSKLLDLLTEIKAQAIDDPTLESQLTLVVSVGPLIREALEA